MKTNRSRQGSALVVVLSFTLLSTILAVAVLTASSSQARVSSRQLNMEKSLYLAEAGLEEAAEYIESQKGYLQKVTTASAAVGDGRYSYTITKQGWRAYSVDSVGTANGVRRRVSIARAYLPTFAEFALWMDTNGKIYFIGGEIFWGRVHSNDKMHFSSQNGVGPVFHELASTTEDTYGGSLNNVVFDKGFQMNTVEGSMANVDFAELKSLAGSMGLVLSGATTIIFDGSNMKITNAQKGWSNQVVPIDEDQIVFVQDVSNSDRGTVHMTGGNVDARVTIVAEDDILIDNHITYTHDPRAVPSDNALGLIAKDDVWVSKSAPNKLNVHAAILAAGQRTDPGSFGVTGYDQGPSRGALSVFGSIVQDTRGAVGTFNSNGPKTGYYKNYSFDGRFATNAPPYYPVIDDKIRLAGWSEGPAP